MVFVGIPTIFVLISVFEMARGMWIYHTLAYAIKEGTRFAAVHGQNCNHTVNPTNNCQVTVGQIATVIANAAVGLDPGQLQAVTMQSPTDSIGPATLKSLMTSPGNFPTGSGASGGNPITFTAQYPFQSAIAMFWPGAGSGMNFGTFNLPASSEETVQF